MLTKNEKIIIGVDHGYGYVKTANYVLQSGVEELVEEPPFNDDVLVYNEQVYAVGQIRKEQSEDKTTSNEYYILTLAAIAKELNRKQLRNASNIHLAVGLPYSFFSRQKDSFNKYLSKNKQIAFKYEGKKYSIGIKKVHIFPQGFPMIYTELENKENITVVDIGSRTIDILTFRNGKPIHNKCYSINNRGTLDCIEQIKKSYTSKFGGKIAENIIQQLFLNKDVSLPVENQKFIKKLIKVYAEGIIQELQNQDLNYNITFCGGGAAVIANYASDKIDTSSEIKADIFGNAKGFEKLAHARI